MVNNPYYQPTWQAPLSRFQNEQAQQQIKGRPVSSIDEVRATSIDFDGSIFYFPDIANKKIYTKQINYDGTSTINMYELKPIPVEPAFGQQQYVTREEFETIVKRIEERLSAGVGVETAGTQLQSANNQATSPDDQSSPQFNF